MKKSIQFKAAQFAVLECKNISAEDKLEILGTLMQEETMASYSESREGNNKEEF